MKLQAFSLRDVKGESFGAPMFGPHAETIKRHLTRIGRESQADFALFPADFHLFDIGTYDTNTGKMEAKIPPEFICAATTFFNRPAPVDPVVVPTVGAGPNLEAK